MNEIVVGLGLSVASHAALAWAAAQARLTGQRLRAIHALAPPAIFVGTGGSAGVGLPLPGVEDHYVAAARTAFAAINPEEGWELQFIANDPGPVLVAESRHASLLVIGTRDHTGWGRVVSGSVSHYCLSHAHCPVLAVPVERGRPDSTVTAGEPPTATGST